MARRNLLAEAQVQAAAEVAPQVYALQDALHQARIDRNSAIHSAASAYVGLSGAIHRAGKQQRGVFSEAKRSAAGTDAITAPAIAGNATIAAAAAHEGKVGGRVLAQSLASRLADLSDRRIAAAAGRTYSVNKANTDYSAAAAKNAEGQAHLAAQQGLLTGSAFSKLTEAAAGRKNQRLMQQESENFQASQSQADHAFTAHQNALGRRSDRINTGISARSDAAKLQSQQDFTASQNAASRKNARTIAGMRGGGGSGPKPTAATTFKGRQAIQAWVDKYAEVGDMSTVHGQAKKKNTPSPIINAAADLYSKGHIAPDGVAALERMGIAVPKEWKGVTVRSHTRSRRSK